jgi:hypothetical protein
MDNPNTGFVIGAYAVGIVLLALEVVLVQRRLTRAKQHAERTNEEDDSAWNPT